MVKVEENQGNKTEAKLKKRNVDSKKTELVLRSLMISHNKIKSATHDTC
jgi:hypothetical protein